MFYISLQWSSKFFFTKIIFLIKWKIFIWNCTTFHWNCFPLMRTHCEKKCFTNIHCFCIVWCETAILLYITCFFLFHWQQIIFPSCEKVSALHKISILKRKKFVEKILYDRCVYKSVDDYMLYISQKSTEKITEALKGQN